MTNTRQIPVELLERAIELLHNYRDMRLFKDRKYTTEDDEALGCFIADLESVKAAEETKAKLCKRCGGSVEWFSADCDWCRKCGVYWPV